MMEIIKILIFDTHSKRANKIKNIVSSMDDVHVVIKHFPENLNNILHEMQNSHLLLIHTNDSIFHDLYLNKIINNTIIIGYSGGTSADINPTYTKIIKKKKNYLVYINALPPNGDFSESTENDLKTGLNNLIKEIDKGPYSGFSDILNQTNVKLKDNLSYLINQLEFLIDENNQIDNQKTLDLENKRNELLKDFD